MSAFTGIDLSTLPAPSVVETLSFEAILADMLSDLQTRDPAFNALVESDPAYKVLEVAAYRETLLRQRVNDAARETMLAYASGSNLEQLAALFGVTRNLIDPGSSVDLTIVRGMTVSGTLSPDSSGYYSVVGELNGHKVFEINSGSYPSGQLSFDSGNNRWVSIWATAPGIGNVRMWLGSVGDYATPNLVPSWSPVGPSTGIPQITADAEFFPAHPPIYESDDELRRRAQLALEGFSTAGPEGAYIFHSLRVAAVKDAAVASPEPGDVLVTILGRDGDGTPSQETLDAVLAILRDENVRPLTDNVSVQAVGIVEYEIVAEIVTLPGPDPEVVLAAARAAIEAYTADKKIGRDITLSGIYAALHQPGVERVNLYSPLGNIIIADHQAGHCNSIDLTLP